MKSHLKRISYFPFLIEEEAVTMKDKKPMLKVMEPQGLCFKCIEESYQIYLDKYVFAYCGHHESGGVYNIEDKMWHVFVPIELEKFKQMQQGIIRDEERYQAISDMGDNHVFH